MNPTNPSVPKPTVATKNLKGATELTVIANIKQGLVQIPDPMSYAARLERLLDVLFMQRKKSVEFGATGFVGPLEKLRSLHFVHWAILDEGKQLLLTVAYDKPWEPYIRSIVDEAGPLLDVIFFHCEGFEKSTTRHGYPAFAKWVREHQCTTNFFFADFPELSVDDVRYHQKLRSLHDGTSVQACPLDARVDKPLPREDSPQLLQTVLGLYRLKSYYPPRGDVAAANTEPDYTDRDIYNRAVRLIAQGYSHDDRLPSTLELKTNAETAPAYALVTKAYNDFEPWYEAVLKEADAYKPVASAPPLDQVQGNILASYGDMSHGCVVLTKLPADPAKRPAALQHLQRTVTTHAEAASALVKCNVSFTFTGFKAIGLSRAELAAFPVEFRDGMESRAGALGDVNNYHPDRWRLPVRNWPSETPAAGRVSLTAVDAVVTFQVRYEGADGEGPGLHANLRASVDALQAAGLQVLHVQPLRRYDERRDQGKYREHFGYLDGISNPEPVEKPNLLGPYNNEVSHGEALVGYTNDHGDLPTAPVNDILRNGSFLVVRKLAQRVDQFDEFVTQAAKAARLSEAEIREQLMGRTHDGDPITNPRATVGNNGFNYDGDLGVGGCPYQAHIRLANPRTESKSSVHGRPRRVPRLIRRGFSYGAPFSKAPADQERGLMFMAYGSSIAEQYEIVQRWLNGGNSTGLPSTQNDPISAPIDDHRAPFRFRTKEGAVVTLPPITNAFIALEWGLYTFAPSKAGLSALATRAAAPAPPTEGFVEEGRELLKKMAGADDIAWRTLLEGQGPDRERALRVWAAVRETPEYDGLLQTTYATLVGREDYALQVLTNERLFSAKRYGERMEQSQMPMHLGLDAEGPAGNKAKYEAEAIANPLLAAFGKVETFCRAYAETKAVLDGGAQVGQRRLADLFVVGEQVIARLSRAWFGLPDASEEHMAAGGLALGAEDKAHCPSDFTVVAQYVFRAQPDKWTEEASRARGAAVQKAAEAYVRQSSRPTQARHAFVKELALLAASRAQTEAERTALVVRALVGAIDGFVAANWGSFVTVFAAWVKTQELWQVQTAYEQEIAQLAHAARELGVKHVKDDSQKPLLDLLNGSQLTTRVVRALMTTPVPAWLHREALVDTQLGRVQIKKGDQLVINLGSAAAHGVGTRLGLARAGKTPDKPVFSPDMLFGGSYEGEDEKSPTGKPRHACPAQKMGMGVMLGMMVAVLERKSIRVDGPLAINFDV